MRAAKTSVALYAVSSDVDGVKMHFRVLAKDVSFMLVFPFVCKARRDEL